MSIPTDWDEALVKAGFVDGRSGKGPSWSQLAKAIGVHVSTLTSMRDGTRVTDGEIVAKVAEALRLDVLIVSGWVGRARTERNPYEPPEVANLLDAEERRAVTDLIRLLAKGEMRGGTNASTAAAREKNDLDAEASVTELRPAARRNPKLRKDHGGAD